MSIDFDRRPFLVIWEVTRACALACVHCRADAIARRNPRELTTGEAFDLIDQIRVFGKPPPLLVLTGGDPMWRKDLVEIVARARAGGLTVALTPSGTAAATRGRLQELKDAGLSRIAVSLDGPDPATHDAFRRVNGSFLWTMRVIESAIDLELPLQINSTVSRTTLPAIRAMAARVAEFPIALWAVFFLVQTGRGASVEQITAEECEDVLQFLYELSLTAAFGIKTTEAPHYRRIIWEREIATRTTGAAALTGPGHAHLRAPRAVNDGNGFVFVDHVGNICPSGFLPSHRGNVREGSLAKIYREDPVFQALRNPDLLAGKCGRCRFRTICGGSRSRAYAETGNMFASDSLCSYEPGPEVETPVVAATAKPAATPISRLNTRPIEVRGC